MHPDRRRQLQSTNWQVANCTTPANYFHILRRQIARDFRKPLILATPKSLLRHKSAVSSLDEMAEGTRFKRVIPDQGSLAEPAKVRRLIFCTGKVYYDLAAFREQHKIKDVAIARVEQISPFPFDKVAEEQARFPNAEIVWVQEEPMNMGAWTYVQPRLETALRESSKRRPVCPSLTHPKILCTLSIP
jgi:2-oxoglutarate dehydrogenase E1 component